MFKPGWSRRAVITYILLQLPGMLLLGLALLFVHAQFDLQAWAAWLIFFLWMAKDAILFFFLWPAYDQQSRDMYSLAGHKAWAATDIGTQGRVRLHGQTWPAQAENHSSPIQAGNWVEVIDRKGLVLIVRVVPSTRMK
ncbi:MAG: NfeD family protein [Desulfovermiculus sp.]|nr:NfeD family protein [Desulfovermiculus sp.]